MPGAEFDRDDDEEEIELLASLEYDEIIAAILTLGTLGEGAPGHDVPTVVNRYREVLKRLQGDE
jgi:hypothetical protein